jgi:antitoxin component YwqK of YwqJK toxin-antitoxin module
MKRLRIEELDYPGDGLHYHAGQPFTGVAVYEQNGWLQAEEEYRDGLLWGTKREWFRAGGLQREAQCAWGAYHGTVRDWHENGRLAGEEFYEYGIRVRGKRRNEEGSLVEDFSLRETDPAFRTLQLSRAAFGGSESETGGKPA